MKKDVLSKLGACILVGSFAFMSLASSSTNKKDETNSTTVATQTRSDWLAYYAENGIDVVAVDAEVLFEYGAYYSNQTVSTVITVGDTSYDHKTVKARTENNDSYFYSIIANCIDNTEFSSVSEGDVIVITGVVDMPSSFGSSITLNECHLISTGDDALAKKMEYENQREQHLEYAQSLKTAAEEAAAQQAIADREEYISNCQTVSYSDVERNPDTYDGTYIVISGEVLQVAEGWFDTVTMRIGTLDDAWYVTYYRADGESRILEGDNVTVYGRCTGVTTYTSVMGNSVTVPSMHAEIIDVN